MKNVIKNKKFQTYAGEQEQVFLAGGGELGELIRTKDWSKTSLGPVEKWPQSLKIIVRIMLTSQQPIWIGWGSELIKLYNDPYKSSVGGKHPQALGQPASVVWSDIWKDIEPLLRQVMEKNQGTYSESQLLIMERNGYPEETYYTFSYSPVPGSEGEVGGIICVNTDDTQRVIGERQLASLRELAALTADAKTVDEACTLSAMALQANAKDVPFGILYRVEQTKKTATLAGAIGIDKTHTAVPEKIALDSNSIWPIAEVVETREICIVSDLGKYFNHLPKGSWDQPPHQAVAVPITKSSHTGTTGVMIVGLNPYRLFDENYQRFLSLVSGQIASSIAHPQAYEEERKRAEEALEQSGNLMKLINDAIPAFISYIDPKERYQFVNRAYEKWFGVSKERVRGKTIAEILGEEAYQNSVPVIKKVLSGEAVTYENTLKKNGEVKHLQVDYVPDISDDGSIRGFVVLGHDITERKAAEEELRYHATISQNIADAVIGTDLEYRIKSWNKGAEKLYRWKAEEVIGKLAREIIPTEFLHPDTSIDWQKSLPENGFWKGEIIQKRKDGMAVSVLASVAYVKDSEGNPVGAVAVNRDITARKRAEEALRKSEMLFKTFSEAMPQMRRETSFTIISGGTIM